MPAPVASCWPCEAADLQRLAALHLSESVLLELEHSEVLPASEIRGLHKEVARSTRLNDRRFAPDNVSATSSQQRCLACSRHGEPVTPKVVSDP